MSRVKLFMFLAFSLFFLYGCDEEPKIFFLEEEINIEVGESIYVDPILASYEEEKVEWNSNNVEIANVDSKGEITGVSEGTTLINVSVVEKDLKASIFVNVEYVNIDEVRVLDEKITLDVDDVFEVHTSVLPSNATKKEYYFVSNNDEIITIKEDGSLKARAKGKASIEIYTYKDILVNEFKVDVLDVLVENLSFSDETILTRIDEELDLNNYLNISPLNASHYDLNWEYIGENASVSSDGVMLFDSTGPISDVSIKDNISGITSSVDIHVNRVKVDNISLSFENVTLKVGDTLFLEPSFDPENATIKDLKFESFDEKVASVNNEGLVTAHKEGSAKIEIISLDSNQIIEVFINVEDVMPTDIEITNHSDEIIIGETKNLETSFYPSNTSYKDLIFESLDEQIIIINQQGVMEALNLGEANIKITSKEDENISYTKTFFVKPIEVESMSLNFSSISLLEETTFKIEADIYPNDATFSSVFFSSGDENIAHVDEWGVVYANQKGETIIYIESEDGKFISQTSVHVYERELLSSFIRNSQETMYLGGEIQLEAIITSSYLEEENFSWSIEDETILENGNNGVIRGIGVGETFVNLKENGDIISSYQIAVLPIDYDLRIASSLPQTLYYDDTMELEVKTTSGYPIDNVVWHSDDEEVAYFDSSDILYGNDLGVVNVYASINNIYQIEFTIEVKINSDPNYLTTLYEKNVQTIVSVYSYGDQTSTGSGVVVYEDELFAYIYTNEHVVNVDNLSFIDVVYSNYAREEAQLVGYNFKSDVAVLKVEINDNYKVAPLADGHSNFGESVFSIGNPLNYSFSINSGIVSDPKVLQDGPGGRDNLPTIKFDAPVNPGNSGGPLFNLKGEVIGIISFKLVSDDGTYEGNNFAIDINHFDHVANSIIESGEYIRPTAGIKVSSIKEFSTQNRDHLNISDDIYTGLFINEINNSQSSTLEEGQIIVGINGKEVKFKYDFIFELYFHSSGDTIQVTTIDVNGENQENHDVLLF